MERGIAAEAAPYRVLSRIIAVQHGQRQTFACVPGDVLHDWPTKNMPPPRRNKKQT
jgi:hypothetical protein